MTADLLAAQELAARVAGAADLLDVRMLNAQCSLDRLAAESPFSYTLDLHPKVEHDEGEDYFAVRMEFHLRIDGPATDGAVGEENAAEEPVAELNFEWAALYNLVGLDGYEPTDEELQAYADTSATLTLYPYAREFVNSMTNRFGLPKLVLPTHRMPSPWHPDK